MDFVFVILAVFLLACMFSAIFVMSMLYHALKEIIASHIDGVMRFHWRSRLTALQLVLGLYVEMVYEDALGTLLYTPICGLFDGGIVYARFKASFKKMVDLGVMSFQVEPLYDGDEDDDVQK
jgi:hypothetical protein